MEQLKQTLDGHSKKARGLLAGGTSLSRYNAGQCWITIHTVLVIQECQIVSSILKCS